MTPKQIANNMALIAMADMNDDAQAANASTLLVATITGLQEHLSGQFEIAGCSRRAILHSYRDLFEQALLSSNLVTASDDLDEAILDDPVEDEEETDEEKVSIVESSLEASAAQLKELAMGAIRDKGKFLPLEDIDLPDEDDKEKKAATQSNAAAPRGLDKPDPVSAPRRRNLMGTLGKA